MQGDHVALDESALDLDPESRVRLLDMGEVFPQTLGSIGAIGGIHSGHPIGGGLAGVGAGLAAMGIATLFTRGADVNFPNGTQVEMVLQRPLYLEDANLAGAGVGTPANLVPSTTQPKPISKPNHARIMCPPGGLGCEE